VTHEETHLYIFGLEARVKAQDAAVANAAAEIAALTAERDALRAALRPFAEIGKLEFLDTDRTIPVHLNYCIAARRALGGEK
jgi:hypothetical protein